MPKISISISDEILNEIDKKRNTKFGELKRSTIIVGILEKWLKQEKGNERKDRVA